VLPILQEALLRGIEEQIGEYDARQREDGPEALVASVKRTPITASEGTSLATQAYIERQRAKTY
jgi:hypothetical protein